MDSLEREIVFFEIAMAIGNSLDLREMCNNCLKVIVKKLNASFGEILLMQHDNSASQCTAVVSIPRRYKRRMRREQLINTLNESHESDYAELYVEGTYCYIFRLHNIGYLVFGRKDALDLLIARTLVLLAKKLSASIQACLNHSLLKESLEQAKALEKVKSEFLANMSHEIRTPMNSILGYVELVLESPHLQDTDRKQLLIAKKSADSLLRIINDVLDFSKLEKGKLLIENRPFSLYRLMEEIRQTLELSVLEKGLKFDVYIDPEISGTLTGDPFRLKQVIINLISNAVKFTQKGRISVRVGPTKDKSTLQFTVEDTGIGIQADLLSHIFDSFSQGDSSTTRRFGGTGLGTTIARKLVELMGGRIWVESKEGKGSTFYFTIKTERTNQPLENSTVSPTLNKGILPEFRRGFKILLVEDTEANITLAKIRLEKQGHHVTVARNGREGVEAFKLQERFDIILMDIHMPEMNGIEAVTFIRELETDRDEHIPIIAMTAGVMKEEKAEYLSAGMNGVVAKPVDFMSLFRAMEAVIPDKAGDPALGTEDSRWKLLVVDDAPDNLQLIRKIFQDHYQMSFAIDGKKALDIVSKIKPNIILLDTRMPEMDGYEVFRRLKNNPESHDIPVVFMIAGDEKEEFQKRLGSGPVDVVDKPIDISKIREKIKLIEMAKMEKCLFSTFKPK